MKKNVGTIDRTIRALVGIAAIGANLLGLVGGTPGIVALVVGVVLVATAAIGWCPPYTLLGVNTCATRAGE